MPKGRYRSYDPNWYPCGHPRTPENTRDNTVPGRSRTPWYRCRTCWNETCKLRSQENREIIQHKKQQMKHERLGQLMARAACFTQPTPEDIDRFALHCAYAPGGCLLWHGPSRHLFKGIKFVPRQLMYLWTQGWPEGDFGPIPLDNVRPACGNPDCVRGIHLTATLLPAPLAKSAPEFVSIKPLDW